MPKSNPLVSDIHALYARSVIHTLIYGYIRGAQRMLPSVSKKEAAIAFMHDFETFVDGYTEKDVTDIWDSVNRDILNKHGKKIRNSSK